MGYQDLWVLEAVLDEEKFSPQQGRGA